MTTVLFENKKNRFFFSYRVAVEAPLCWCGLGPMTLAHSLQNGRKHVDKITPKNEQNLTADSESAQLPNLNELIVVRFLDAAYLCAGYIDSNHVAYCPLDCSSRLSREDIYIYNIDTTRIQT